MANFLESGASGLSSSLGQGTALCSLAKHFTLTVPLFNQVYKWVPEEGITRQWASIPSR